MTDGYQALKRAPYPEFADGCDTLAAHGDIFVVRYRDHLGLHAAENGERLGTLEVEEGVRAVAFSPDGERLLLGLADGTVLLVATEGLSRLKRSESLAESEEDWDKGLSAVFWLNDGNLLGLTDECELVWYDIELSILRRHPIEEDWQFFGAALTLDHARLWIARTHVLLCVELASGEIVHRQAIEYGHSAPAVSPDGQEVAWISDRVSIRSAVDGSLIRASEAFPFEGITFPGMISEGLSYTSRARWSEDGSLLAVNLPNGVLRIYEAPGLGVHQTLTRAGDLAWGEDVLWVPETPGELLLATGHARIVRVRLDGGLSVWAHAMPGAPGTESSVTDSDEEEEEGMSAAMIVVTIIVLTVLGLGAACCCVGLVPAVFV